MGANRLNRAINESLFDQLVGGNIGVRANINLGGAERVLPEWIQWGGGVVAEIFQGSIICVVAQFFPLTPVTGPKLVAFFVNCSNRP